MTPSFSLESCVRAALEEDLGRLGDITSTALIPADTRAAAHIIAREAGTLAGMDAAMTAFRLLDADAQVTANAADGASLHAGDKILSVKSNARALLAAERAALNFLSHLSGIATETAEAVAAVRVAGGTARICCTRKTTPGLRVLEKQAVMRGGGLPHRFGLDDAMLIKDNHLALYAKRGGIAAALKAAHASAAALNSGGSIAIIVEVDDLTQLQEALEAGAKHILLDNMDTATLAEAVRLTASRALLEASGGITTERLAEVARTGVDFISLGRLTHSAPALDFSLEMEAATPPLAAHR